MFESIRSALIIAASVHKELKDLVDELTDREIGEILKVRDAGIRYKDERT